MGDVTVHKGGVVAKEGGVSALEGTFANGLKATSVMASRFYAEDFVASGVVTVQKIKVKSGGMDVNGLIEAEEIKVKGATKVKSLEVEEGLVATTADVGGVLSAGKGEFKTKVVVGGKDLLEENKRLEAEIAGLKELVEKLAGRITAVENKFVSGGSMAISDDN
jgi:hypothetical protein